MNLFVLSSLLTGISSLVFGIYVYSKNKKNKANQLFAIFTFSVAIWGFGGWRVGIIPYGEENLALLWWRVIHVGIIFIPVFFLHFVYTWLNIKNKFIVFLSYFISIFFLSINLFDLIVDAKFSIGLFINNISWVFNSFYWDTHPNFDFYLFFVVFWIIEVIYAHYKLFQAYQNSFGLKRVQIKYFFIAVIISYSGGITSFLPCFNINLYPVFNLLIPFYPALMTYAIIAHHLLDIKLIMRRSSVFLASLSVILILVIPVKYFLEIFFYDYFILVDLIILIVALFIFNPIKKYFYYIANKYFFSSLYDSQEVISSLSDKLSSTLEIDNICNSVVNVLTQTFHIKTTGILVCDNEKINCRIQYNNGINIGLWGKFINDEKLYKTFFSENKIFIVDDIRRDNYYLKINDNKIIESLINSGIEILMPLVIKEKKIGLIALGNKESNDMYNKEDVDILKIVGMQMAISLENALLYQQSKNFNIKLEKEIKRATNDLQKANKQLKKLDIAKSEFISIASHQLRTPLTVIKGYISMILEDSFGKLTELEKKSLEKVFQSNERLIELVENLLNISRIESGRLQFNFLEVDFGKIVAGIVDELSFYAKKKNLLLKYQQFPDDLPLIRIDEEKIRQVIINLIDNAIKYTKQGDIIVKVELINKVICFSVADKGVGIKCEDKINLFKKFSRCDGSYLVNSSGAGLGLYVARIMIEQHQGKIWVESEGENKGSKFYFELPLNIVL